jgi:hypothetical protein
MLIHHKASKFGLIVGIIFLVITCGVAYLTFYLSRDFLHSEDAIARKMPFLFSGIFFLLGAIVAVIFVRQEFDEQITIDATHLNYVKSGRLRRTIKWSESIDMYKQIEQNEEEATEESRILTLKLKHSRNPEKDVVLEKDLSNEKERTEKRAYYKKLLKLD